MKIVGKPGSQKMAAVVFDEQIVLPCKDLRFLPETRLFYS